MKVETKETPILFIIFNRPETTKKVFAQIKRVKPKRLYIAADAPRPNFDEEKLCNEARSIVDLIDWECEVKKLYRDKNLGCGLGPKTAIDWFFDNEEEGIILEDDCVPSLSFFRFCSQLLFKYRNDTRIMHIGGSNFQNGWVANNEYSYYFSYFSHEWGWASWRRAWKHYDFGVSNYNEIRKKGYFDQLFSSYIEKKYRLSKIEKTLRTPNLTWWDYQWDYAKLVNSGLSIIPNINLVKNIGFGENATHTKSINDKRKLNEAGEIDFPLSHPEFVIRDTKADRRYFNQFLKGTILRRKILGFLGFSGYSRFG